MQTFPANLLINADDFGLDPRISLAIARCVRDGLVHSFSCVPFRDPFHAGLLQDLLRACPGVKVGVHLCLVELPYLVSAGSPSGPGCEPPAHFRDFLRVYAMGKVGRDWLYREWKAQIETVASHIGGTGNLAHLDSHQNLHVLPGPWSVALRLQREFGIPRLRVPFESLRRSVFHRFPFGLAMQALARWRANAGSRGFIGFFTSTSFTVAENRIGLRKVLENPQRQYELMVHPALPAGVAEAARDAGAEASTVPGTGNPFRSHVRPSQEKEVAELIKLKDFYRAWAQPEGFAGPVGCSPDP